MAITFTLLLGMVIAISSFLNYHAYRTTLYALGEARVQTLASDLQWSLRQLSTTPDSAHDKITEVKSRYPRILSIEQLLSATTKTEVSNDIMIMTVPQTHASGEIVGALKIRYAMSDEKNRLSTKLDSLIKTALIVFAIASCLVAIAIFQFYRPFIKFVLRSRESLQLVEAETPPSFDDQNIRWQEEVDYLAFQTQAQTVFAVLHEAEDYGLSEESE